MKKKSEHFGLVILLEGPKWHQKTIKPDPDEGGNKKLPPSKGRPAKLPDSGPQNHPAKITPDFDRGDFGGMILKRRLCQE